MANTRPWLSAAIAAEPRLPLVGPYMAYLFLMLFAGFLPDRTPYQQLGIAMHIAAAAGVAWMFRPYWPPLGRAHVILAMTAGVMAAVMWVVVQRGTAAVEIAGFHLGGALEFDRSFPFVSSKPVERPTDIAAEFPTVLGFWSHVVLKIARAITIVPIVEELFWRGFILRALIDWHRYDAVPLGSFAWTAFIGSSLLSIVQHPANWFVSIPCWMLYNALFCWKKSLLCLMLTHAVTNFALYVYVVRYGDWQFW